MLISSLISLSTVLDLRSDLILLLPDVVLLLPDVVPLLPDVVPLLPDVVPLLPDVVPLLPDVVLLLPDLALRMILLLSTLQLIPLVRVSRHSWMIASSVNYYYYCDNNFIIRDENTDDIFNLPETIGLTVGLLMVDGSVKN